MSPPSHTQTHTHTYTHTGITPRAGVLQNLTVAVAKQALSGGLAVSDKFKTASTYLVQVLALDSGTRQLFQDYLDTWRPLVAGSKPAADDAILFLNSKGMMTHHTHTHTHHWLFILIHGVLAGAPCPDVSKIVSVLWESAFGRKMSINVIRYWKDTQLALAATTAEARERILTAECHSAPVSQKWYRKIWATMDAALAKKEADQCCKLERFTAAMLNQQPPVQSHDFTERMAAQSQAAGGDSEEGDLAPLRKKRRVPWDIHDSNLLLESAGKFAHLPDRWEQTLEFMLPNMNYKRRTGANLKDRYRTLQNVQVRKLKKTNSSSSSMSAI